MYGVFKPHLVVHRGKEKIEKRREGVLYPNDEPEGLRIVGGGGYIARGLQG